MLPPHVRFTWQAKFIQNQEALLHGDLHTGSIMATGGAL